MTTELLQYRDNEGVNRTVKDCRLTQDKSGKHWLWCERLKHNLACKVANKEDALMAAIDSLLFTIELQQKEIEGLRKVYDLAEALADHIKT